MKIGLFFGSFNPVHTGHMIIANYMVQFTDLQQVWMVVSPLNPFKTKDTLANDYDRLHLVELAIGDNPVIKASNIEFHLPKPSYTIETLIYLKEKYPQHEFALIMGGDNLLSLPKWKNAEIILRDYTIYVYKRSTSEGFVFPQGKIIICEAPLLDISATFIRQCLKSKKSVQYMVPDTVYKYLAQSNLYQ